MNWTIYRGKIEPVTKINKADITLYTNHLEIVYDYEFIPFNASEDRIKSASTWSKNNISIIEIGEIVHGEDVDNEVVPTVFVKSGNFEERIRCATQKEAENIYLKLREWYLA